jgi:hypothetical protein
VVDVHSTWVDNRIRSMGLPDRHIFIISISLYSRDTAIFSTESKWKLNYLQDSKVICRSRERVDSRVLSEDLLPQQISQCFHKKTRNHKFHSNSNSIIHKNSKLQISPTVTSTSAVWNIWCSHDRGMGPNRTNDELPKHFKDFHTSYELLIFFEQ